MTARASKDIQIVTDFIRKTTHGAGDMINLTPEVQSLVDKSHLLEGSAAISVIGSTAGITTIEFEPGLVNDMKEIWQKLVPQGPHYFHHETWGDANGFSHIRAAIQGPSLVIPFKEGSLLLGQWQQIVLLEFDDRPRDRKIVIQLIGK
jgi:secondary thiamine-phosphate synthase enzyme